MTLTVGTIKNITQTYAKMMGKQHIIETCAPKFRGVNPRVKYLADNHYFYLNRFCTEEMRQARTLNKIAIRQAKKPIALKYSNATQGDLRRLMSNNVEDCYSRVVWTNPKDGKIYNIIKQGETTDGQISIRILDEQGTFVKNALVQPKTITIVDVFGDSSILNMSHGFVVESFAKRYNPFARFNKIDVSPHNWADIKHKLMENLKKNGACDYLSMSLGSDIIVDNGLNVAFSKIRSALPEFENPGISDLCNIIKQYLRNNSRVLISAGNNGKFAYNDFLVKLPGVEGVGSLIPNVGKISPFSGSRNSFYTQHYEVGEIPVKKVYKNGKLYGLSFTGQGGCDILVSKFKEFVEKPWRIKQKLLKNKENQMSDVEGKIKQLRNVEANLLDRFFSEKQITPVGNLANKTSLVHKKYQDMLYDVQTQLFKLKCKSNKLDLDIKELNAFERVDAMDILSNFHGGTLRGTSFATPIRVAKLSLDDMMKGIL